MEGCDAAEERRRLDAFHTRTAACATDVILRLGGIYVKLGQVVSTIGAGIFEDEYIAALRPLQDGVPPRSLSAVAAIIEASVLLKGDLTGDAAVTSLNTAMAACGDAVVVGSALVNRIGASEGDLERAKSDISGLLSEMRGAIDA